MKYFTHILQSAVVLLFLQLIPFKLHAQYNAAENKIWVFGLNALVDFNSGSPVGGTSTINTQEGCASVCNSAGSLLFYTDGRNVYNRLHTLMPNGNTIVSYSTSSTTQAALIVPKIGTSGSYYVFSKEEMVGGARSRLAYSEVDMSLAGGLGDVLTSARGIPIGDSLSEKMIAIPGNSCNIWVVVHKKEEPVFLAYEVTSAGINTTPVRSTTGTFSGTQSYQIGVIKSSHNGRKIALAALNLPAVGLELYDFDPNTGTVSNCQVLNNTDQHYGAEFSPDNTKLYVTSVGGSYGVIQYDVTGTSTAAIIASKTVILPWTSSTYRPVDLMLGPDRKIYFRAAGVWFLDCIQSPNLAGTACNHVVNAVNLGTGRAGAGLHNTYYSLLHFDPNITGPDSVCVGATISLSYTASSGTWSSGTTSIATIGASTGVLTGIAAGTCIVSYIPSVLCGHSFPTKTITVLPIPPPITGSGLLCSGSNVLLSNALAGGTWSSTTPTVASVNATSGIVSGLGAGTATIYYTIGRCPATKTVTVNMRPSPIYGVLAICTGTQTTLSNTSAGGTWTSGNRTVGTIDTAGIVMGVASGTATITYTVPGCGPVLAILRVSPSPSAIVGPAFTCPGATISYSNAVAGGTWTSSNVSVATISATTGIASSLATGTTTITYMLGSGCYATALLTVSATLPPITGPLSACVGDTVRYSTAATGGIWSATGVAAVVVGTATGRVAMLAPGTATITYALGSGCFVTTTIAVLPPPDPGAITGDTAVCAGATTTLNATIAGGIWSNSTTVATISAVGVVTGLGAGRDTVLYTVSNGACARATRWPITVHPSPPAGSITGPDTLCPLVQAVYTATIADGTWSSSNPAVATIDNTTGAVTTNELGTALITYTSAANTYGCKATVIKMLVVAQTDFRVASNVRNLACYGDTVGQVAISLPGGPYRYVWSTGDTTNQINNLVAGNYTVTITELTTGCTARATYDVLQPANALEATVTVQNSNCGNPNGSILAIVGGGTPPYRYTWAGHSSSNALLSGIGPGNYQLNITDQGGCTIAKEVTVTDTACKDLVIHDVITPNGDGVNDTWIIEGIQDYPNNEVTIFDKLGDPVFTKQHYQNDWSGNWRGGLLPDGTYYYLVQLNSKNATTVPYKGSLLIKR